MQVEFLWHKRHAVSRELKPATPWAVGLPVRVKHCPGDECFFADVKNDSLLPFNNNLFSDNGNMIDPSLVDLLTVVEDAKLIDRGHLFSTIFHLPHSGVSL